MGNIFVSQIQKLRIGKAKNAGAFCEVCRAQAVSVPVASRAVLCAISWSLFSRTSEASSGVSAVPAPGTLA